MGLFPYRPYCTDEMNYTCNYDFLQAFCHAAPNKKGRLKPLIYRVSDGLFVRLLSFGVFGGCRIFVRRLFIPLEFAKDVKFKKRRAFDFADFDGQAEIVDFQQAVFA